MVPQEPSYPVKNTHAESCPPGGLLESTGLFDAETGALIVTKPATTDAGRLLVNGLTTILPGGHGIAYAGPQVRVAYDPADGVIANGEDWGPTVAGGWLLKKAGSGFVTLSGGLDGLVNCLRTGAASAGVGRPRAANLTEATGPASGTFRSISGGIWIDHSDTFANSGYAVQADGTAMALKPTATVIAWEEPSGSGVYALFPVQYADEISLTYYPGLVSTGNQTFKGEKTFVNNVNFRPRQYTGQPGVPNTSAIYADGNVIGDANPVLLFRAGNDTSGQGLTFQTTMSLFTTTVPIGGIEFRVTGLSFILNSGTSSPWYIFGGNGLWYKEGLEGSWSEMATRASNTFTGDQTVNGDVTINGDLEVTGTLDFGTW